MTSRTERVAWGAVLALAVWSAWTRYHALAASPFPIGVDGYFYPVQLRSLLAHGTLRYPASPLAFWAMAPLAALTDPITGAKLGAAIGGAAIAVPMYAVGRRLGGIGGGLVAAAIATTSAGSWYLTLEFVKNGIGMTVAMFAVWAALVAIDRRTLRAALIAAAVAVAAALTHKMALGIAAVVGVPAAIAAARARGVAAWQLVIVAGVLGVVAVAAGVMWPQRFVSDGDLGSVASLVEATPHWQLPALVQPHLAMGFEAWIGAAVAVAAVAVARAGTRAVVIAAAALSLFIAIPWLDVDDAQGLAMRLRAIAFVPLAICAAAAARGALARLSERRRDALLAGAAVAIAGGLALAHPDGRLDGEIVTHPALASAVMAADGLVPDGGVVVVPERHIAFMVAWYTGADVSLRPDAVPHDRRLRLMPLAFIGDRSPLDRALLDARKEPLLDPPIGLHSRHPDGLVLVTETTWEWMLARLSARARAYYAAWPTI